MIYQTRRSCWWDWISHERETQSRAGTQNAKKAIGFLKKQQRPNGSFHVATEGNLDCWWALQAMGEEKVKKYLLVGQRVWHMAFTPDEKFLFTTNGLSNDVSVIDVARLRVVKTIAVGELPWGIAMPAQ